MIRKHLSTAEALVDFTAIAERWRAFCADRGRSVESEPLAIMLLYAFTDERTGDIVQDVLSGMLYTVIGWRRLGEEGGGGVTMIDLNDVRALERRLVIAVEFRRRERLAARPAG